MLAMAILIAASPVAARPAEVVMEVPVFHDTTLAAMAEGARTCRSLAGIKVDRDKRVLAAGWRRAGALRDGDEPQPVFVKNGASLKLDSPIDWAKLPDGCAVWGLLPGAAPSAAAIVAAMSPALRGRPEPLPARDDPTLFRAFYRLGGGLVVAVNRRPAPRGSEMLIAMTNLPFFR